MGYGSRLLIDPCAGGGGAQSRGRGGDAQDEGGHGESAVSTVSISEGAGHTIEGRSLISYARMRISGVFQ